jgi:hypothetical protein
MLTSFLYIPVNEKNYLLYKEMYHRKSNSLYYFLLNSEIIEIFDFKIKMDILESCNNLRKNKIPLTTIKDGKEKKMNGGI